MPIPYPFFSSLSCFRSSFRSVMKASWRHFGTTKTHGLKRSFSFVASAKRSGGFPSLPFRSWRRLSLSLYPPFSIRIHSSLRLFSNCRGPVPNRPDQDTRGIPIRQKGYNQCCKLSLKGAFPYSLEARWSLRIGGFCPAEVRGRTSSIRNDERAPDSRLMDARSTSCPEAGTVSLNSPPFAFRLKNIADPHQARYKKSWQCLHC